MAFHFKLTIDGKTYEKKQLSMGEMQILKRQFGVQDFGDLLDITDPDTAVGLLYLCRLEENPNADADRLLREVQQIEVDSFAQGIIESREEAVAKEKAAEEGDSKVPPPSAGEDGGQQDETPASSGSAKTRKGSGSPS